MQKGNIQQVAIPPSANKKQRFFSDVDSALRLGSTSSPRAAQDRCAQDKLAYVVERFSHESTKAQRKKTIRIHYLSITGSAEQKSFNSSLLVVHSSQRNQPRISQRKKTIRIHYLSITGSAEQKSFNSSLLVVNREISHGFYREKKQSEFTTFQ